MAHDSLGAHVRDELGISQALCCCGRVHVFTEDLSLRSPDGYLSRGRWILKRLLPIMALAFLAIAGTAEAQDALAIIGAACIQGNQNACSVYRTAVQQQTEQARQQQQAVDGVLGYLQRQQAIQQEWPRAQLPMVCHRQGYTTTVCQ